MSEERTAPTGLVGFLRCCQPSKLVGYSGIALAALLLVVYLVWGRQWLAMHQEMSGQASQTLISIVDVFSCCVLTPKILTVMLPAFVLAGAISVFLPTPVILRYLGAGTRKATAYSVAAVSGMVLSLCSCNVIPLFASIYRRGAGLGPAFTFLFAGPAINVVAMIFTFQVIGVKLGVWRAVGVPIIAIAVGLIMAVLFRREAAAKATAPTAVAVHADSPTRNGRLWLLFGLLLVTVIYGAWDGLWRTSSEGTILGATWWLAGMVPLVVATAGVLVWGFERSQVLALLRETWANIKLVVPVLLPAVLAIGALAAFIDVKLVYRWVGSAPDSAGLWGTIRPILVGTLFGEIMYFPILTEVAFTKAFLKLGMGVGPALAVLLTGPGTSLPGAFIIARAIGWKKALAFELVAMAVTAIYAVVFATEIGEYICACMMN